jgi:hypothetical protein
MLRQSQYPVAVLISALAIVGCAGDQYVTDAPPRSAQEADKWWAETLDRFEPDFLAVLCVASEAHRQNGTTATCIESFSGRTMAGWYHRDLRLPLPLPDTALARAKARLVGWAATGDQPSYDRLPPWQTRWHWEGGKGCSDQKAEEIWQEAEKKSGWRRGDSKAAEPDAAADPPRD